VNKRQPATCRSCGADILWAYTPNGKRMPFDAATTPEPVGGTYVLDNSNRAREARQTDPPGTEFHMNHFATCPQGKSWSKGSRT
jgi:hypothetical protein